MASKIITPRGASLQTRLALRAEPQPNGCIHFIGCLNDHGYGMLLVGGKAVLAHRASYACHVGPLPADMDVLHTCDNPTCIGAGHLFLGTQQDNIADMLAKGRGAGPAGSRNSHAKLTIENVLEIRASSERRIDLARRFNVATSLIHKIRTREVWKHV